MQVVRSVYDFLTVPDAKGGYAPYLAKAIDHDPTYSTWTITLRAGVAWHDGTPFTAEDVKFTLGRAGNVPNSPSSKSTHRAASMAASSLWSSTTIRAARTRRSR